MFSSHDCDECKPAYAQNASFGTKAAFSTIPFSVTYLLITLLAYRRVYPLLSTTGSSPRPTEKQVPYSRSTNLEPPRQILARRIAALTFSSTIALSAVLTELLLCEISNSFNPTARTFALQITVASLLGLLVVAIPLLGISSVVSRSGYGFNAANRGRRRLAWTLELTGYLAFLTGFWFLGALLPETQTVRATLRGQASLFQACLDRLGITGVSLMALLSGFASVSAIWQNLGPKPRRVYEADITRKQTGLGATHDMIAEKRGQLQRLHEKTTEPHVQSLWSRTMGTFRGSTETQEKQTLEMEITGLETMSSSLEATVNVMRTRRADQLRETTKLGRVQLGFSYLFSIYCTYRIAAALVSIGRRLFFPFYQGSDSDPITAALAIVARYIYPSLDQEAWAQQISFLLSGAMLLASFSAVTQTFHLFSRFLPSMLHATKTNFALLISQISGMYVISSALMLRGMMPKEVGGVINGALGAGSLEPAWVQKWFESFFISAVILTAVGIWIGRQIGGSNILDDDDLGWDGDVELGKRS